MLGWLIKFLTTPAGCEGCGSPHLCWKKEVEKDPSFGESCVRCGETLPPPAFKHNGICKGCWND